MSEPLKWADVHMHYHKPGGGFVCEFAPPVTGRISTVPILLHLEDMTPAQMLEYNNEVIRHTKLEEGKFRGEVKAKEYFRQQDITNPPGPGHTAHTLWLYVDDGDGGETTFAYHELHFAPPYALHWLIQKGFDVFGLIESGQAIRKGVQP
jgi:hypothetical protein